MNMVNTAGSSETSADDSFFVASGVLPADAPSYVVRVADTQLVEALSRGELCYVLTARQMGKSSLIGRAAVKLRTQGVVAVVLDLSAGGQNVSAEQWYYGLLMQLGRQFGLRRELDAFWVDEQNRR